MWDLEEHPDIVERSKPNSGGWCVEHRRVWDFRGFYRSQWALIRVNPHRRESV